MTARQRQILLGRLRSSPRLFGGLAALGLLAALLETFSVFALLPLAAALFKPTDDALLRWGLLFAALVALRSAALLTHARLSAAAGAGALHEAKTALLHAYTSASDAAHLELKTSSVSQRINRSAVSSGVIVSCLPQLAAETARALALATLIVWLNFRIAVGLIAVGAVFWELFSRLLSPRAYARSRDRSAAEARQSVILGELLRGTRQLRLAGAMDPWRKRFEQASLEYCRHHAAAMALQALPRVWFDVSAALVVLGWMSMAAWQGPEGAAVDLTLLAALVVAAGKLMPCLAAIGRCRLDLAGALPDIEAMENFLERYPPAGAGAGRLRADMRLGLKLEGVGFSYPGRMELLKGVDLDIPAGRSIVILGPFGCGKTTVLGLLLGLHEPSSGRVLLDGRPLREFDRSAWWERVGIVPQEAFVFAGTIAENILLDRTGYAREAVERSAALVGAHDFIATLPQGYETLVGVRGLQLSGGQRQLVLLARALLSDPRVLMLDEPAQALDPHAQEQLAQALRRVARGRTVIMAMHRPGWASWADTVVRLQDGKLIAAVTT